MYNGPVYIPKHIYHMLSDDVKKKLDKYNQEKKAKYKSSHLRMAKVHEQDHDEAAHPYNQEPDLENHLPDDSYPMQEKTLKTTWKHMVIAQPKWHKHITSPNTLLPPMGL